MRPCQHQIELLPWLLNGSLEGEEKRQLLAHLETCCSCQQELAATSEAARLTGQHVPSLELVDYALGLPASGLSRDRIERHLEFCASCQQEVALARADQVADLAAYRERREKRPEIGTATPAAWRKMAMAASILAALAAGATFWAREQSGPPSENPVAAASAPATPDGIGEINESAAVQVRAEMIFGDGFEPGNADAWATTTNSPMSDQETSGI